MGVCAGYKRDGSQCTATVEPPQSYCWWHDPANKEERKRAAAKDGRGKAHRRVATLWEKVEDVIGGVEAESLSPSQGNTMIKGFTTLIALARLDVEQAELAIAERRLELDVEERQELLGRLEVLEEMLEENKRGEQNRYGGF
jgi:hypothetical protein